MPTSGLTLTADSWHKRLQEESSPSHADFLSQGGVHRQNEQNFNQVPLNKKNNPMRTSWLTNLIQPILRCILCQFHPENDFKRTNACRDKPFTKNSSYTFQRSPETHAPSVNGQVQTPQLDLILSDEGNIFLNTPMSDFNQKQTGERNYSTSTLPQSDSSRVLSAKDIVFGTTRSPVRNKVAS